MAAALESSRRRLSENTHHLIFGIFVGPGGVVSRVTFCFLFALMTSCSQLSKTLSIPVLGQEFRVTGVFLSIHTKEPRQAIHLATSALGNQPPRLSEHFFLPHTTTAHRGRSMRLRDKVKSKQRSKNKDFIDKTELSWRRPMRGSRVGESGGEVNACERTP